MRTQTFILLLASYCTNIADCQLSNEATKLGQRGWSNYECAKIDPDSILKTNPAKGYQICTCKESHQVDLINNRCSNSVSCTGDGDCFQSICVNRICAKSPACELDRWSSTTSEDCGKEEVCAFDTIDNPSVTTRVCLPKKKLTERCSASEQCNRNAKCENDVIDGYHVCSCPAVKFVDKSDDTCSLYVGCLTDSDCFRSKCHKRSCVRNVPNGFLRFLGGAGFVAGMLLFAVACYCAGIYLKHRGRIVAPPPIVNHQSNISDAVIYRPSAYNQDNVTIMMASAPTYLANDAPPCYEHVTK